MLNDSSRLNIFAFFGQSEGACAWREAGRNLFFAIFQAPATVYCIARA
jgi:hypothetical protein